MFVNDQAHIKASQCKTLPAGVDKVAWWLQAQRGAVSMAPAVFAVVSECVSSAQAGKQTPDGTPMDAQTSSHDEEGQPEIAESENILKRGLDCAAAWFKLGVLLTIPGSAYECAPSPTFSRAQIVHYVDWTTTPSVGQGWYFSPARV